MALRHWTRAAPTNRLLPRLDIAIHPRRAVGWTLCGLLGIEQGDKVGMQAQFSGYYRFFGAPVGIFLTINRIMQQADCSFATFYPN
jgi:hypothetical protein